MAAKLVVRGISAVVGSRGALEISQDQGNILGIFFRDSCYSRTSRGDKSHAAVDKTPP